MKKICVIGGAGFLGSHVCDQLSDAGYEVVIFDTKKSPWARDGQLSIQADIFDEDALMDAISGCGAVYNFAAIADLDEASEKPIESIKVNILGNAMILEACKKLLIPRIIYASTVYVQSRDGGFYRCSKNAAEQYVREYQTKYGLNYTILRYGSIYGPRSDSKNGLWRIVSDALANGVVSYSGSPDALRDYIHVTDAAHASVKMLDKEFENQHIVLTGHESMRVYDLLKMLAEILDIKKDVSFVDASYMGHYIRTPYAFSPQPGKKYIPSCHVDLGQGLLQLIEEINSK